MSKGGGSGSTQVQMSPEQQRALSVQTDALEKTFIPAYEQTIGKGKDIAALTYDQVNPLSKTLKAQNTNLSSNALAGGTAASATGLTGLESLFDPNYETNQINAALQTGRETARESYGASNATFGGSGNAGSARQALAQANLSSLDKQRQATAAATAQAGVQANKAAAANALVGGGQNLLNTSLNAGGAALSSANAPMDLMSKYASIVFGVPQGNTTPNFAGTQGNTSQSSNFGFNLSDINAKQDIKKIGVLSNGINLYKYHYKPEYRNNWGHGLQMGVLAQEVEKIIPEAVIEKDGVKMVNYSMVFN